MSNTDRKGDQDARIHTSYTNRLFTILTVFHRELHDEREKGKARQAESIVCRFPPVSKRLLKIHISHRSFQDTHEMDDISLSCHFCTPTKHFFSHWPAGRPDAAWDVSTCQLEWSPLGTLHLQFRGNTFCSYSGNLRICWSICKALSLIPESPYRGQVLGPSGQSTWPWQHCNFLKTISAAPRIQVLFMYNNISKITLASYSTDSVLVQRPSQCLPSLSRMNNS